MSRLGYDRYGAQGGDWGAVISRELGRADADRVIGVHVNAATVGFMPIPPVDESSSPSSADAEQAPRGADRGVPGRRVRLRAIQSTRPQTLAYALTDSPVGQLAWIVEKFQGWTHGSELPEDAVDRDRMLTNVMLYWLTGTAGSSATHLLRGKHTGAEPQPSRVTASPVCRGHLDSAIRGAERDSSLVEGDRGDHSRSGGR